MKDNFTSEDLIQFLDGELEADNITGLQEKLRTDTVLSNELDRLKMSRQAIRYQGLSEKVGSIHRQMMAEMQEETKHLKAVPVIGMFRPLMRIAAIIMLLLGITAVYQYAQLSPDKIFTGNYTAFNPGETRGQQQDQLAEFLQAGKSNELIASFSTIAQPTASDYFYAGNAYLQLGQAREAIAQFQKVAKINSNTKPTFFEDDTDYYLAMAFLKNEQSAEASLLLSKIHQNPEHLYHDKVSSWLVWKARHAH